MLRSKASGRLGELFVGTGQTQTLGDWGKLGSFASTAPFDLEQQKILDKTLSVVATEFGRSAAFNSGIGRGHQGTAFPMVMAGGGLNHCGAYGVTDNEFMTTAVCSTESTLMP